MTFGVDNHLRIRAGNAEEFHLNEDETATQDPITEVFRGIVPSSTEVFSAERIENPLKKLDVKVFEKSDEQLIKEALINSEIERLEKMTQLTAPQRDLLIRIDTELDSLSQPAEFLAEIINEQGKLFDESQREKTDSSISIDVSSDSNPLTGQDISEIQAQREERREVLQGKYQENLKILKARINLIISLFDGVNLPLNQEHFSGWHLLPHVISDSLELAQYHLPMIKEQFLNRVCNCFHYLETVRLFIDKHKFEVLREFYQSGQALKIGDVHFSLKLDSFETHNEGKVACEVTFFQDNQVLFKVFFKPRNAKIDSSIIAMFEQLNKVDEKSLNVLLPVFKIVSYESEDCSLWEFIDGRHPAHTTNVEIEKMDITEDQKKRMRDFLIRLESVCNKLNISDLHKQNVLITTHEKFNSPIVPIDLESIQPGSHTGLYEPIPPHY